MMGEYDNMGFPLSYSFLTTASAIPIGKRMNALTAWARVLKIKYKIEPKVFHVDKDMAEIGMIKEVWPDAKISLCAWHMQKAVRERLAKSKLSTTPYLARRANQVFSFIDPTFLPPGQPDRTEYEGGKIPNEYSAEYALRERQYHSQTTIRLPPPSQPIDVPLTIHLPAPTEDRNDSETRRFCPEGYRPAILEMLDKAYCAHPFIPGYSNPHPKAIHEWATRKIYTYCVKYDLREVWAYLWENWLRPGRWELWARSACIEMIPVLKTTMIIEAQ
jgi:hypothetical protein